jgi:hypothetical protein
MSIHPFLLLHLHSLFVTDEYGDFVCTATVYIGGSALSLQPRDHQTTLSDGSVSWFLLSHARQIVLYSAFNHQGNTAAA